MKNLKIIIILFSLFFVNVCHSQSENWNLLTTSRQLSYINFIGLNKGLIYGGNIVYKTTNEGMNWVLQNFLSVPIDTRFNNLTFVDSLYGWSRNSFTSLAKTTNGGIYWNPVSLNVSFNLITSVYFINRNTGWIAGKGYINNYKQIIRTTNGGANWNVINSSLQFFPNQIYMQNSNKGFIIGDSTLGMTTDSGFSWTYQSIGGGQLLNKIQFVDSLRGFILGNNANFLKTTNGGANWIFLPNVIGNTSNMYFIDSLNGWITESSGGRRIWKTTNGGTTWQVSYNFANALDIYFKNINTGWATLTEGTVLKTTNSGINWFYNIIPPAGTIRSIDFRNNTGLAVSYQGKIYKSNDRGYNWINVFSINNSILQSVDFVDDNTGFVCGDSGRILKTTNSGNNFVDISFGNKNYNSIFFLNNNTGFICGSIGAVLKTTNGGLNWSNLLNNNRYLNDIFFINSLTGYIASDSGLIFRTSNGGLNWTSKYAYKNHEYRSTYFINENTGFAVGDNHINGPPNLVSGTIVVKTTDSGLNWTPVIEESYQGIRYFNDIIFVNELTGYLVKKIDYTGYISKTTNGGENWYHVLGPVGYSQNNNDGGLYCISAVDESNIWAAGDNGTIVSTSSPVGIHNVKSEIPKIFLLCQNYPNPFNPQTKIKFDVPSNVKRETSNVKLIIYDLLGREVTTLVNEELRPGTYEADWDGSNLSSGVYFYKIISNKFTETRKMVLMK